MDPVSPAARVVRSQFNALYARLLSRNDDGSGSNSPSHNPRSTLDIFPASTAQPNPDRSSALETYPALASQPAADDRSAFENSCSSRLLAHPSPSPLPTSNSSLPPVPASTHTSALVPVRAQAPVHSLQAQDAALLPGPPRRRPRRRPTFAPIVRKRPRKAPSASSCDDTGHEARRTRTAGAGASGPSIPREEVCAVCRGVARVGGSVRSRRTTPRPCNGVKDCSARLDGACHVKGGGVRGEEAAEVERGGESEGAGGAGGGCAQLAPCNHVYHTKCIVPWLELRNTCAPEPATFKFHGASLLTTEDERIQWVVCIGVKPMPPMSFVL